MIGPAFPVSFAHLTLTSHIYISSCRAVDVGLLHAAHQCVRHQIPERGPCRMYGPEAGNGNGRRSPRLRVHCDRYYSFGETALPRDTDMGWMQVQEGGQW